MIPSNPEGDISNTVSYFSEDIEFTLAQTDLVSDWIKEVIHKEGKSLGYINFIFCSDSFLHQINLKYLNHDTLTDVISFPYADNPIEGEIYISIDRIKENSEILKTTFSQELLRIMVHGTLHLIGYLDKEKVDKERMVALENLYLEQIKIISD